MEKTYKILVEETMMSIRKLLQIENSKFDILVKDDIKSTNDYMEFSASIVIKHPSTVKEVKIARAIFSVKDKLYSMEKLVEETYKMLHETFISVLLFSEIPYGAIVTTDDLKLFNEYVTE